MKTYRRKLAFLAYFKPEQLELLENESIKKDQSLSETIRLAVDAYFQRQPEQEPPTAE